MALIPQVWAWLAREREGALHPALGELLYEAGALARRLNVPLVGLADRPLSAAEQDWLRGWQVHPVRALPEAPPGGFPPHPLIAGGRSPLAPLAAQGAPRCTFFLADTLGQVAAPLWAAECGAALVPGATSATCSAGHFVVARPTLGGQCEALASVPLGRPLVVTLRPGAVGEVGALPPAAPPAGAPIAGQAGAMPRIAPPEAATLAIGDAERIVAFGRGAFSKPGVALVGRLAELLGAALAGSRPAADEGWLPFARQVGLTGAIVSPRLYVAVGISGAPYHMVGIKDPGLLIAINQDPEAPILASAHLGLVGDLYTLLPRIIARLEQGQGLPAALASALPASPVP